MEDSYKYARIVFRWEEGDYLASSHRHAHKRNTKRNTQASIINLMEANKLTLLIVYRGF